MTEKGQRYWLEGVFPEGLCDELVHVHEALNVLGYMDYFTVVTFGEFMSKRTLPFLLPILKVRGLV